MMYLEIALKALVGLSILNVWLLRSGKATPWRGGDARSLREEFSNYGLPIWFMRVVGTIKVLLSITLILSIWYEELEFVSALGIGALMLGAIFMHLKVADPFKKSIPALSFLISCLLIIWL